MHFAFLGTSGAIPTSARDTTSLVFAEASGAVLVDCGGSPVARLRQAGVNPLALRAVLVTHLHADHAYGLPALVQGLRLLGRREPLAIRCRPEHVEALRQLLALFGLLERAPFSLALEPVPPAPGAHVLALDRLVFSAAPNEHGAMPNFAVRVDVRGRPGRAVVYSSDTAPCPGVAALARGAHTLVHEATFPHRDRGRFGVHATAREAGQVAREAGVRRLILAHVEAEYHGELDALAAEAREEFGGEVEVARELVPYPM